ncbi:uncharacterized protein CcaverHIS019_0507260 [Cutaneotrichosporon cavernicola]|uniref:Citrate transporter-like domain-containing protein n=1 Tax=Cutaneotrichosporon cavernicola TaxID=279322 RepID=A0AA48L6Z1_9TREE|nr:uncharacterized protein CcaverHIS019_0507260 [Cutaneotrichosporon cavernicola]BEI93098.1 hypothetical protein CcaverHIS019_0507260 [Cutaneotrichosporon cavernicola]
MTSTSPGEPGTPTITVSTHAFQATPGTARAIDARSIVTLIIFFVVNALVIFPLHIPIPRAIGHAANAMRDALLGLGRWDVYATAPDATDGGSETACSEPAPPAALTLSPSHAFVAHSPDVPPESALHSPDHVRPHLTLGLATAPVAGVLLLLASTCIPGSVIRGGIVSGVRPYDIMTLFLSFAYISLSLDCTGLLRFLAFTVASHSTSSGKALFLSLYVLFVLLSLGVGNDPVVLSGTPFVAYFTTHTNVNPTPFLFAQFQAANLASALLVSSNPTNLVLTSSFHLSFLSFSAWTALPTLAAAVALYPVLAVLYRKLIPKTLNPPDVNPRDALVDPTGAIFTSTVFIVAIIALIALSATGQLEGVLGVWTVTGPAAVLILLRDGLHDLRKRCRSSAAKPEVEMERVRPTNTCEAESPPDSKSRSPSPPFPSPSSPPPTKAKAKLHPIAWLRHTFPTVATVVSRLPLPLLPFAFSMFILVDALEYTGWVKVWAHWWAAWAKVGGTAGCIWLMGLVSVLGCNILGTNIGLTVLLSRILVVWRDAAAPSNRTLYGSVLALAIGSNFGAYSFVFSASLAGLLWRDILAQKGLVVGRLEFMRWNMVPLWTTMAVACLVIAAEVCIMF